MTPAPIALFVYRRPDHTRRTIAALRACPEFTESPVVVFSDGPRDDAARAAVKETRTIVSTLLPDARIVEAQTNRGLAESIIAGVSALTEEFGRVIVVEDDLIVAPDFLTFLNAGLEHYADNAPVMQISGHMFGVDVGPDPVLLPFISTWGWGTWARAWRQFDADTDDLDRLLRNRDVRTKFNLDGSYNYFAMLQRQRAGTVDSWGIRWYGSVFRKNGLTVYPPRSRVLNVGFDEGTHGGRSASRAIFSGTDHPDGPFGSFPNRTVINDEAYFRIKQAFRTNHSLMSRIRRRLGGFLS